MKVKFSIANLKSNSDSSPSHMNVFAPSFIFKKPNPKRRTSETRVIAVTSDVTLGCEAAHSSFSPHLHFAK